MPRFFRKNFVKLTFYYNIKNFTTNCFDGKKFSWQWISYFSTLCTACIHNVCSSMEKRSIYSHSDKKSWNQRCLNISCCKLITQCGKIRNSLPRKFFVKSSQSKLLCESWFDGTFAKKSWQAVKFRNFHTVVYKAQCGNYGNSLSRIFGKNFVKVHNGAVILQQKSY